MAAGRAIAEQTALTQSGAKRVDLKTKLLTAFVVGTNVLGNFAMSWGLKHQPVDLGLSPWPYIRLIFTPWVLLGTTLLILWLLSRMTLLGWADLSYVLPVTSIGYVASAILGKVFFGEQVTWQRWLGTVFIVIGIIFVGLTAANTTLDGGKREPAR
ncbi:MAG: EamA family transporter [Bryobacteraceae bacterium]